MGRARRPEVAKIRTASDVDREAVRQLWEDAGLSPANDREWGSIIEGRGTTLLVAEEDGKLVGSAVAAFDGWRAYIYHVAVAPSQQGKGLAKLLMGRSEGHLKALGAPRAYVLVAESNTAGIALSEAMGFEPEGDVALVKQIDE